MGGGGHLNRSVWWFCRSPNTETFSIYTYIGVDILNIVFLDLDRHSDPPFLKMAAVFINVAISYQIWHLES